MEMKMCSTELGSLQFLITANVGTEGAVKKFPIWDVSEEFPITQSALNRLT
jgi:hypothetical protein